MNTLIALPHIQKTNAHQFFSYATYPLLWSGLVCALWAGVQYPDHLGTIAAVKGGVIFLVCLALELIYPIHKHWGITWSLLARRDLPMVATNGAFAVLLNYALVFLAIGTASESAGVMSGQPLWLQIVAGLLVFEVLQYSIHRCMHVENGPVSRFFWHVHAIHHLPQQLYLVMHTVFHPVNYVIIRIGVQLLPIWVLGFDAMAVFIYGSVIALNGTVSHLNFDLRLGWMNYIFVGPELHRYHHSAKSAEAVNYGAALSLFDLLLGTFRYTPGQHPEQLGLTEEDGYPGQKSPVQALLFPFRG